jgi:hypothetical protein
MCQFIAYKTFKYLIINILLNKLTSQHPANILIKKRVYGNILRKELKYFNNSYVDTFK